MIKVDFYTIWIGKSLPEYKFSENNNSLINYKTKYFLMMEKDQLSDDEFDF